MPSDVGLISAALLLVGLLALILIAVLYDIWVYRKYGYEGTISRGMQRLGRAAPIFPFCVGLFVGLLVGILSGHFWWSQP